MEQFIKNIRHKRRILVVDDEAINRELLETILSLNYEVDTAADGQEALDILTAAKEPYSLILLDLLMPRLSGFQLLELCKADERLKEIPIIVMTSEKSAEVRSIRMGADDFISKPYRMPEAIIARCERIIELSEEKSLIRSIEKDKVTGLYIDAFFGAYVRRLAPDIRRPMDAVVLKLRDMSNQPVKDSVLKRTAELITDILIHSSGIACYIGSGEFGAFCEHHEDYEALTARMREALTACSDAQSVRMTAGIFDNASLTNNVDDWFKKAS